MRNVEHWKPSKFVVRNGHLRGSRDPKAVGISSRVMVDLIAGFYERTIPEFTRGALIDLGCGKVPLYATYRGHTESITCVDWANTMHPNPHLDHEQDLNRPLAFPDAAFDTMILSDVLEHIRRPEELLREMYRVLRPEGHVLMNVPYYYGLHEEPFDYFRYTRHALMAMSTDAGFQVVRMEAIGGVPEIIADLVAKTMRPMPVIGRPTATAVQRFTGWFCRTGWGRKISARTSAQFPFGYALVLSKSAA